MAPNIISTELYTNEPLDAEVVDYAVIKGDKGDKGDIGPTPAFFIGEVATLGYDQPASANITGTDEAPVLNLGIPKGKGAYTQAVEGGYTGDEEEFNSDLANIKTYAYMAEDAEANAETYASNASASASGAAASATAAANSATDAAGEADRAEQAADDATGYATNASASASSASGYAATASTKANDAASSASAASDSADAASQSASSASSSATAASGSASAAAGSAANASSSATAANTAKTAAETAQGKAEDAQEAAETAATNAQASADDAAQSAQDAASEILKAFPHDTASGSIANFPDGAALPVRDLTASITPIQAGSGDPSPDNIRPISGWTGAKVTRTGKNLCGESFKHGTYSASNGEYYSHEGASSKYVAVGVIPIKGGQTYTISWENDPTNIATTATACFYRGSEFVGVQQLNASLQINAPENVDGVGINLLLGTNITSISQVSISNPQLELGSTASTYEPYQGQTYTIDLNGSRYGGTLDVTSGKMVVDRAYKLLNDADKWVTITGTVTYRYNEAISRKLYDNSYAGLTCTIAPIISDANYTARWQSATTRYFGIADKATTPVTSLDAIKAMATAGQIAICYAIEPIEVDLTPTEISTLLGTNNIFADCGDTTVDYYADTTLFVNKKIAAAVAAMS